MTAVPDPLRAALAEVLRSEADFDEGLATLLDACDEVLPGGPWQEVYDLAWETDAARVAHWLREAIEGDPPPADVEALWFRLRRARWHGRLDGCELELFGGPIVATLEEPEWTPRARPADCAALGRLVRMSVAADGESLRALLSDALPAAATAWLASEALQRLDESLALGRADARAFLAGWRQGPVVRLGVLDVEGWDDSEAGFLEQ